MARRHYPTRPATSWRFTARKDRTLLPRLCLSDSEPQDAVFAHSASSVKQAPRSPAKPVFGAVGALWRTIDIGCLTGSSGSRGSRTSGSTGTNLTGLLSLATLLLLGTRSNQTSVLRLISASAAGTPP